MKKTYSLYEAKARFSELIRMVREHGTPVTITYHGQPVAEITPVQPASEDPFEVRYREMVARGVVIPGKGPLKLKPIATIPGALQRFLEERD